MPDIIKWIDEHPSTRLQVRWLCFAVVFISLSCIAGHIFHKHILFDAGLELGMSAITATCNILLATALLLLVRDAE